MRKLKKYSLIDLFSGAGGLSLGFSEYFNRSFDPVWANDNNKAAVDTYNANLKDHCVLGDIIKIIENRIEDIPKGDIVIGGPPCQGFSLLNKKRQGDERKQLWRPFLRIVEHCGASVFLMENVPQLIGSDEYQEIEVTAESMGFKVKPAILCAADYGVPQLRWRAFILGCNFADPGLAFPPKKTHIKPVELNGIVKNVFSDNGVGYIEKPSPWRKVRDAISDLPDPEGTEIRNIDPPMDLHFGRKPTPTSLQRYHIVSEEGMNRFDLQRLALKLTPACWIRKTKGGTDLFGRLWWDRPAFTIRTEFFKPEKGRYLHPSSHRPITHREAARLQSFPDFFVFKGSKIEIAKQIGNAVPPLLASAIAGSVEALLSIREENHDGHIHSRKKKPDNVGNQGKKHKS